jgi:hypothetical protein
MVKYTKEYVENNKVAVMCHSKQEWGTCAKIAGHKERYTKDRAFVMNNDEVGQYGWGPNGYVLSSNNWDAIEASTYIRDNTPDLVINEYNLY